MKTPLLAGIFLAAFAASTGVGAAESQILRVPSPPAAETSAEAGAIALAADKKRHLTLDVTVAGKGPFPFLIDTGAENTLITRELADELDLREGPRRMLHSMDGSRTVRSSVIPHLAASHVQERNITVSTVLRRYLDADGILGLSTLKSQRLELDFKTGAMTLAPSREREDKWEGESIVVSARSRLGQLILTQAAIGPDQVLVILDTGNHFSVGNPALRRVLSKRQPAGPHTYGTVRLTDINGNTTQLDYRTVGQLRVATLNFQNVPVGFADARVFDVLDLKEQPALLLGMDVLRLFGRVSIDFGNRRVRFQIAGEYDTPTTAGAADSDR